MVDVLFIKNTENLGKLEIFAKQEIPILFSPDQYSMFLSVTLIDQKDNYCGNESLSLVISCYFPLDLV